MSSTSVEQIDRASKFLRDHSLKEDSILRKCCMLSMDLLLLAGLICLTARVIQDEAYWGEAPYPIHVFILVQYAGLALFIRLPVSRIKANTQSVCLCFALCVTFINTILGFWWMNSIRQRETDDTLEESKW